MINFLIVAGTMLISSLLTATFIVAGIEYLYIKFDKVNKNRKKENKND